MVLAFPAGAGIETPGIPDGNPGIEAFLSFAMTSNINWIKIIIIIIIIINDIIIIIIMLSLLLLLLLLLQSCQL